MLGSQALGLCVRVHGICVQLVKLLTACMKVVDTYSFSVYPPLAQQENYDTSQMQDSVSPGMRKNFSKIIMMM